MATPAIALPPGAKLLSLPPGATLVDSPQPEAQDAAHPVGKSLEGVTISAEPQPQGIREKVERWAQNVRDDIHHGTDLTGVGTVLKFLGAHGIDYGAPEKVGEFMAGLPLGLSRATEGAAQVSQGRVAEGVKNVAKGAWQAAEMPLAFVPPEGVIGKAATAIDEAIPNAKRAGESFQSVMGAAHSVPINVTGPGDVALQIQHLSESGATRPKVIGDFLKRVTDPEKGPLTYQEARDFYTNATRLSSGEAMKLTPVMKRQVAMFTQELNQSLEQAAEHVGKLDQYQQAMQEYHKAMRLRAVGEAVKDAAKNKAVQTAVGTGLGYALAKEVSK